MNGLAADLEPFGQCVLCGGRHRQRRQRDLRLTHGPAAADMIGKGQGGLQRKRGTVGGQPRGARHVVQRPPRRDKGRTIGVSQIRAGDRAIAGAKADTGVVCLARHPHTCAKRQCCAKGKRCGTNRLPTVTARTGQTGDHVLPFRQSRRRSLKTRKDLRQPALGQGG